MNAECMPISSLPGTTPLFRDYAEARATSPHQKLLRSWYPSDPFSMDWAKRAPQLDEAHRQALATALCSQAEGFNAGAAAFANIEKLRHGAAAIVTGQQVALFGGPLLTLLKAATAIRKAQDATKASGREHVPVFWLASEDHDLAEVDQVPLLTKTSVERLTLGLRTERAIPVGSILVEQGTGLDPLFDRASELLTWAPVCDLLRECYAPGATLARAFGRLISTVFAEYGLIVLDAASRDFHALGAAALLPAIEQASELEAALLTRSKELETAGYHAQVLVAPGHSLLFLLDAETSVRQPLRRSADGGWKAGQRQYTSAELLGILQTEPERLSPNALLRPVFQDCVLPTAAYVGGPAEIAYFAQSAAIYEVILGRVTPVLPRLSATLIEPAVGQTMDAHGVSLTQVFEAKTADALALRLGARAMPLEAKRKVAAAGNAMETELAALTDYMTAQSADLGRAAGVSASKMRYQMERLRRMAAGFEVQKQSSLKKHATAIMLSLYPDAHLQERLLAGVWFLARYGDTLPSLLVEHAGQECPGHRVISL